MNATQTNRKQRSPSKRWYIRLDGRKVIGPATSNQLKQMIQKGTLQPTSQISADGRRWHLAARLRGVNWPQPPDQPPPEPEKPTQAEPDRPRELFSPRQIAAGAFVGGLLTGFLLLAFNYRKLGKMAAAGLCLAAGVLGLLGIVFLGSRLPAQVPPMLFWLLQMGLMFGMAKLLQDSPYQENLLRGGKMPRVWKALGLLLVGLAVSVGIAFLTMR
jgi:hypothetical protein